VARRPVAAFAVDARSCQLVWRSLPAGRRRLGVGSRSVEIVSDGDPGAVWIDGLTPGRDHEISLDGQPAGRVTTLRALAGPLLARVATVSDLHIGQGELGRLPRLIDPPNLRCLEVAIEEITAWGADLLVVKGDLTEAGTPEEWRAVIGALSSVRIPTVVTFGNHDVREPDRADPRPLLAAAGIPFTSDGGVEVVDLPGLRVIVADTTTPDRNLGTFRGVDDQVVAATEDAQSAVLLAVHHHLQALPVPHHWPPGIPSAEARRFATRLDRTGKAIIVTSGHTHRHRARRYGRLWATEVGSVKDFPGVWARYEAHPGGLRQVVHRIGAPDVLRWTDRTAETALGLWGRWSPGRLEQRCLEVAT
jgi:3',5'-cyclic-AMP phosphodiesterase